MQTFRNPGYSILEYVRFRVYGHNDCTNGPKFKYLKRNLYISAEFTTVMAIQFCSNRVLETEIAQLLSRDRTAPTVQTSNLTAYTVYIYRHFLSFIHPKNHISYSTYKSYKVTWSAYQLKIEYLYLVENLKISIPTSLPWPDGLAWHTLSVHNTIHYS